MTLNHFIAEQFKKPHGIGGKLVTAVMNKQNRPLYDDTAVSLSLKDNDSVLDIGCGNGFMLELLAKTYNCRFDGIDVAEDAVRAAKRRCRSYINDKRMQISLQDGAAMSFDDGSFDKAYSINVAYFWSDLFAQMTEIHRVLRPKGVFYNTLYTNEALARFSHTQYGYRCISLNEWNDVCSETGFTVNSKPIAKGLAYCLICEKM
jgi:cyclopropane fatty-acyl-phospholipid synthase-like methyltransferase